MRSRRFSYVAFRRGPLRPLPGKRTVVVSPVPGDPVAGGAALKNALASITDASETNPYLIKIEPGVYDLDGPGRSDSALIMKPWVDIEGSGEDRTTLTASGTAQTTRATSVEGTNNAELGFLTVEKSGGASNAIAIQAIDNQGSFRLTHVSATASGGNTNEGVSINSSATATLNEVTASVPGGTFDRGVDNDGTAEVHHSWIAGSSYTILTNGTTRVAATQLDGPPAFSQSGTLTCAGVYDENYTFFASSCP